MGKPRATKEDRERSLSSYVITLPQYTHRLDPGAMSGERGAECTETQPGLWPRDHHVSRKDDVTAERVALQLLKDTPFNLLALPNEEL